MNNKYCVYVHIVPNDKKYYGMTKNVKKRWRSNGRGYKQNINFYSDIITYGWDNIKHLIIADNLTKEEAELLEEELIRENRTYDSEYGYNKYIGNKRTDEQKEARSEAISGINHHNAKKVICITTMMVFDCIEEAADYYSINQSSICSCCKGKRKSAGKLNNQKLVWRYIDIFEL